MDFSEIPTPGDATDAYLAGVIAGRLFAEITMINGVPVSLNIVGVTAGVVGRMRFEWLHESGTPAEDCAKGFFHGYRLMSGR